MNERIEAWLRLRDTARFNRDAKRAARNIRDIGDAAEEANKVGLTNMSEGMKTTSVSSGAAMRAIGGLVGVSGALVAVLLATSPIIVAIGGALIALTASAAAATLGLGVLAAGGVGVLAVGLGGLGIILTQVLGGFQQINQAMAAHKLAMSQYGAASMEAATAQRHLNAVVEQFGGPAMLAVVERWNSLTATWRKLTAPAMKQVLGIFNALFDAADRLIGPFAEVTNTVARALAGPIKGILRALSGSEMKRIIKTLGDTFARIAGPLASAAGSVLLGLFRIAEQAAPFFEKFALGVAELGRRFAEWSSGNLTGTFTKLVAHTESWWNLLKATGAVLFTIFNGGASTGRNLVDTLTEWLNRQNEILNMKEGQARLQEFFRNSAELVKNLADALSQLAGIFIWMSTEVMPVFSALLEKITQGLERIEAIAPKGTGFWGGLIKFASNPYKGATEIAQNEFEKFFRSKGITAGGKRRGAPPGFASGGMIGSGGYALVGEQGPEIAAFPSGTAIFPMKPAVAGPLPAAGLSLASGGGSRTVVAKVYLDRRQIAQAVADGAEDEMARR